MLVHPVAKLNTARASDLNPEAGLVGCKGKAMASLPRELRKRCKSIFLKCSPFDDHETTLELFFYDPLSNYKGHVKKRSDTSTRIESIIRLLVDKQEGDEWVLVALIRELETRFPDIQLGQELKQLADDVDATLRNGAAPQQQRLKDVTDYRVALEASGLSQDQDETLTKGKDTGQKWMEAAGDDPEAWAFRIALAVFNGASFTAFDAALKLLVERLAPPPPPEPPKPPRRKSKDDEDDEEPPDEEPPAPQRPIVPAQRSRLLRAVGAELVEVPASIDPETGITRVLYQQPDGAQAPQATVEVVRLKNGELPFTALRFVWKEIYEWREQLVGWLDELVVRGSSEVRLRAATAAGLLAVADFGGVKQQLLTRWLDDTHPPLNDTTQRQRDRSSRYRDAISQTLGVVMWEGRRSEEVRALLKVWATAKEPHRRWAALRAYIWVGPYLAMGEAMRQWKQIARDEPEKLFVIATGKQLKQQALINDKLIEVTYPELKWKKLISKSDKVVRIVDNPLYHSLVDAIAVFFQYGLLYPERARIIFEGTLITLKEWVDEVEGLGVKPALAADSGASGATEVRYSTEHLKPMRIFLTLFQLYQPNDQERAAWPPTLLELVEPGAQNSYRKALAALLYKALRLEPYRKQIVAGLQDWIERAERDRRLVLRLKAVLADLIAADRSGGLLRDLLLFYLEQWGYREEEPLRTARVLYRAIVPTPEGGTAGL